MKALSLAELCKILGVEYHGNGSVPIEGISSLNQVKPNTLVMVESAEQLERVAQSSASAVLHPSDIEFEGPGIAHDLPRVVFAKILDTFHPPRYPAPGVHETASVDHRASVDPNAVVGPFCVVGAHATLARGVVLQGFVVIGEGSSVGENSIIQPHVVIGTNCQIGKDCQLEAWSKLGDAVELGDGVDLGAHTNLAKGVVMESGVKVDNLVLVGPRSRIGSCTLLIGQSAVDRDAVLHPGVIVAGQGSVGPEAILHPGVQIGGRSLALGELTEAGPYIGTPAVPLKEEMRRRAAAKRARRAKTESERP